MAPYRSTSTDSPVGRLAVTRELSCEIETFGVGIVGETGMAEGFLGRSMLMLMLMLMLIDYGEEERFGDRKLSLELEVWELMERDGAKVQKCKSGR